MRGIRRQHRGASQPGPEQQSVELPQRALAPGDRRIAVQGDCGGANGTSPLVDAEIRLLDTSPHAAPVTLAKVGDFSAPIDGSGALWGMDSQSTQLSSLANQPPVRQPTVASVPPSKGLWVTGTDPSGKQLVVVAFVNSNLAGNGRGRAVLDTLIDWVARLGGPPQPVLAVPGQPAAASQ